MRPAAPSVFRGSSERVFSPPSVRRAPSVSVQRQPEGRVSMGVSKAGLIFFLIWAKGERQWWDVKGKM